MAYEPTLDDVLNSLYGPEGGLTEEELAQYTPEPYVAPEYTPAPVARGEAKLGGPRTPYDELIYQKAVAAGQDPNLIKAQIWAESSFDPKAVSNKGAQGLAQFMPGTWKRYSKGSAFDPNAAIDAQIAYNADLLQRFGGDERKVLAAYNWGEYRKSYALPDWESHAPKETRDYVKKILAKREEYAGAANRSYPVAAQEQTQSQETPFDTVKLSDGTSVDVAKGSSLADLAAALKANGIDAEPLKQVPLPDGSYVDAPFSYADEQVLEGMKQHAPDAFGEQPVEASNRGYGAAAKSSFESGIGSALTGLGGLGAYAGEKLESPLARQAGEYLTGKGKEWQKMGEEAYQELTPEEAKAMGFGGQFRKYVGEPVAGFVGSMGAALPALALPGGAATRVGAFAAQELGGQLAEQERMGQAPDVEKALPYAVGSGIVQNSLLGPLKYVTKAFGKPDVLAKIAEITEKKGADAAKQYAGGMMKNILAETGVNTGEVVVSELISRAAERAASGQALDTPDALAEYEDIAIKSIPGGLLGIPGAFGVHAAKQGTIEETQLAKRQEDQAARIAAERQAAGEAAGAEEVAQSEADAELERQAGIGVPEPTIRGEENVAPEELAPIPEEQPAIVEPPAVVPPAAPEITPEAVQEPAPVEPPAPAHFSENLGIASKSGKKTDIPLKRALAQLDIDNPQDQPVIVQALETALPLAEQGKIQLDIPKAQAIINQFKPVEAPSAQPIPQASPTLRSRSPQPQVREEGGDQAVIGKGVEPSRQGIEAPEIKAPEVQAQEVAAPAPTAFKVEELPDNRIRVTGFKDAGIDAAQAQKNLLAAKAPKGQVTADGLEFHKSRQGDVLNVLEGMRTPEVKAPEIAEAPEIKAPEIKAPEIAEAPEAKAPEIKASEIQAVPEIKAPEIKAPEAPVAETPIEQKVPSAEVKEIEKPKATGTAPVVRKAGKQETNIYPFLDTSIDIGGLTYSLKNNPSKGNIENSVAIFDPSKSEFDNSFAVASIRRGDPRHINTGSLKKAPNQWDSRIPESFRQPLLDIAEATTPEDRKAAKDRFSAVVNAYTEKNKGPALAATETKALGAPTSPKGPEVPIAKVPAKPKRVSAEKEAKEALSPREVLAKKITGLSDTLTELHGQIKAEEAKPTPSKALLSQYTARRQNAEQMLATLRGNQSRMLQAEEAKREQEAEAQAAQARKEAARKVQEQGGYEFDLLEAEKEGRKLEKETAARQTVPTLPTKPIKQKLREPTAATEEDIIKRIEEMQAKKKEVKPEVAEAPKEPAPAWEKPESVIRRMGPIPSWTTPEALVRRMGPHPLWEKPKTTVRRMGPPMPVWEKPETAVRRMGPPMPPWEKPTAKAGEKEVPEVAQQHADTYGGKVLYHNKDIALFTSYGEKTGRRSIRGTKGPLRTEVDIEDFTGKLFTPEEKAELIAAKKRILEAEEKAHAANPDGPFKKGEKFAASENVPKEIQEIAKKWQNMLGLSERIYLTTTDDARNSTHVGPFVSIPSQGVSSRELGSKRRLENGDFVIAYRPSARTSKTLETISHEIGHALMDTRYKDASPEVRKALDADYEAWLLKNKGKTARELIDSLRAHATGKGTAVAEGTMADALDNYWKSKDEWFADQVSRWATTDKKPLGVVEEFFSKLAQAMKRFFLANRQYMATKNMSEWLNSLGEANVEPAKKDVGTVDTKIEQARGSAEEKPLVKETEAESSLKKGVKEAVKVFEGGIWTRLRTNYVNRHAALADAIKDKSTIDSDGKYRADLIGSANDQIFNVISAGVTDGIPVFSNAGTVMVQKDAKKNLSSIAKRIDKLNVKNPRAFVGEIARALRGEELKKEDAEALKTIDTLEEKAKKLKAYAKTQSFAEGKKADVLANRYLAEAKKLKDRVGEEGREKLVSNEDIVEAKRRLAKHPEIQGILDDVHDLMNSLVDLWEASGLVSKDVAKDWRSKPSYIPLYMSQEDILNDPSKVVRMLGGGAKSLPNVKALKGGTHAINLLENLQKHYAFMTSAAAQNAYRKAAARDLELFGAAERTSPDNKNAIMFKEDGKEVYYEIFDPLMFEAFQAAAPLTNPLLKAARGYTKAFRAVTLVNPLYWYRQLVRDPIHANVVSQTGMVTPIGATISFAKIIAGASPEYAELRRRGVVGAVDSLTDPARFKKIYDKGPHLFKKGADWVMHVHEAADAATRVEVYKAAMKEAKKRGMGDEKAKDYATMRAREIINFANQGRSETLQAIRATVPFFSAALNSLDSVARAATGKGLNRREAAEARRLFTSRMLMIASFTTAYTLAMQDDEDYLKSPDAVNNWLIPTGNRDAPFKMLSLPFELGFAAKVIPELIVRLNSGTLRPYEGEKMAKEAAAATLAPPLPLPQVLKPLIELAINLDLHTGRPIVSPSEARKLPEEQTRGASALSIELGRKLGLSPIQIEHFGSGYLTELWAVTSMLAEKFLPAGQMREERYPGEVPILAGGSKGISSKPDRDRDVNMFYELSQATQRIHDSVVSAQGKGDVDAMERLMADPENEKRFYASKIGRNIGQTMMEVNKSIEQIRNDKSITDPKEKQIRIRELRQYYNQLASQGVEWFYSEGVERP